MLMRHTMKRAGGGITLGKQAGSETAGVAREFEEKHVVLNGLDINYLEAGRGEKVLLLIHGGVNNDAFSTWSKFNKTIETLSRYYKVFAPDLPGYGRSDKPEECTQEYYVNFIKDFVDRIIGGKKVNIVGTSMGGGMALGYLLENPGSVESAVLVAPSCLGFTLDRKSRLGVAVPNGLVSGAVGFLGGHERLTRSLLGVLRNDRYEAMATRAVRFMDENPMRMAFTEYMRDEAISFGGLLRGKKVGLKTNYADRMAGLNGSGVRLLFIEGGEDIFIKKEVIDSVISNVDCAEVVVMDGCGHSPHFKEPEKFNRLVRSFVENGTERG